MIVNQRPRSLGLSDVTCRASSRLVTSRRARSQLRCSVCVRAATFAYRPPPFEPEEVPDVKADLQLYDVEANEEVDVVVAGAGPAGIATAARISTQGLRVVLIDPQPLQHWPNNYGVWSDEFEAMGLNDCFEREWSKANVWLGEHDERCGTLFQCIATQQAKAHHRYARDVMSSSQTILRVRCLCAFAKARSSTQLVYRACSRLAASFCATLCQALTCTNLQAGFSAVRTREWTA
jgi:Lycopene cyclase protein